MPPQNHPPPGGTTPAPVVCAVPAGLWPVACVLMCNHGPGTLSTWVGPGLTGGELGLGAREGMSETRKLRAA